MEFPLLAIMLIDWTPEAKRPKEHRALMVQIANRHLANLERWLDGRAYIATDSFTVADIVMAHVLFVLEDESLLAPYPRVVAYRAAMRARPSWQRTIESYCARVEAAK